MNCNFEYCIQYLGCSLQYKNHKILTINMEIVRRRGVVGRVPAFQLGDPGSIPCGIRNFNFYPGTRCVSFVCFLSCVVCGGSPDIVLITHSGRTALVYLCRPSVLVQSLLPPPTDMSHRHLGCNSRGYKSYTGEDK